MNVLKDCLSFGLIDTDSDALLRVYHIAATLEESYQVVEENVLSRNDVDQSRFGDM